MSTRLDHTILDPLDREMKAALVAARLVLEHGRHCLNCSRLYDARLFKGPGAKATHK